MGKLQQLLGLSFNTTEIFIKAGMQAIPAFIFTQLIQEQLLSGK